MPALASTLPTFSAHFPRWGVSSRRGSATVRSGAGARLWHQGEIRLAHKFEIYKDKAGEFRVRFKYNTETMFSTEGYASKGGAQNAIDSLKKNAPDAPVEDNS